MIHFERFSCFKNTERKMSNVKYEVVINLNNNKNTLLHNVHLFDRYTHVHYFLVFLFLCL